jgi:hypothetical protein
VTCTVNYADVNDPAVTSGIIGLQLPTDLVVSLSPQVCLRCFTGIPAVPYFDSHFTYSIVTKCITERILFSAVSPINLHYVDEAGTLIIRATTTDVQVCPLTTVELVDAGTDIPVVSSITSITNGDLRINGIKGLISNVKLRVTTTELRQISSPAFEIEVIDCLDYISFLSPLNADHVQPEIIVRLA